MDINVDPFQIARQAAINVLDCTELTTSELDDSAIETVLTMIDQHPDYDILAARLAITKLHKETKERFSEVMADLYHVEGSITNERWLSDEKYQIIQKQCRQIEFCDNTF